MTKVTLYGDKNHKPLGFCMYCGFTKHLTKEHIVPKFLGGGWVLPRSTCEDCRTITKKLERFCAEEMFGTHRIQFGYRSSSGKPLPSEVEFQVHTSGKVSKKKIEALKSPTAPFVAPVFSPPGILSHAIATDEIIFRPWIWSVPQSDPDQRRRLEQVHENKAENISVMINLNPSIFMRVLAKIAHGAAVAEFDLDHKKSLLPDYILGRNQNLAHVVGSMTGELSASDDARFQSLVEFGIYSTGDRRYLTVAMELFRYLYAGPNLGGDRLLPYRVVVLEADNDLADKVLNSTR